MSFPRVPSVRLVLLAVAVCCADALPAQAQTTLRYKFRPGEKLNYLMDQKMTMKMEIGGKEVTTEMKQVIDMSWNIQGLDSAGNAKMTQRVERVRVSMDTPTGRVEFDTRDKKEPDNPIAKMIAPLYNALAGADIALTMSPRGEFSDVKMPEKVTQALKNLPGGEQLGDLLTPEGFKRLVSQGSPVLPEGPVTKGKSWERPLDMKLPTGKMHVTATYTYEGPTTRGGKTLQAIGLKLLMKLEADPNAAAEIKLKGQKAQGTIYFDNVAGRLTETNMTQLMDMVDTAGGMTIQQSINQVMTMKLVDKSR